MSNNEDSESEWEEPTDHEKAIRVEIQPDSPHPVALTISHKRDGLAAKIGLTLEQVAMLQANFEDILDSVEDPPQARIREPDEDDPDLRGVQ